MVKKRNTGTILLAVITAFLLFSCVEKQVRSHSVASVPKDPALIHGVLPNGFQYLVMKNTTPKDRVSVHLDVFAGSVHEQAGEQGIAHFLEHMLFNGSEHFKPGELVTYFQSIGMDFGADANARTSFFTTGYDLNLPKGDRDHLEDGFLVIQDYAGGALLLQSEIDRERGVILAEKRERDSVSYRTFKDELALELPGSLLARRLPIGKEEIIDRADRKLLKGFYDKWYRPDNMALVVVGDVDTDLVVNLIKQNFSHLPDRSGGTEVPDPDISWQPHKGVTPFYLHEPEAGNTQVTIERLEKRPFKPESVDMVKQKTVRFLGDLMLDNRLSRMVRDQEADFTDSSVYSGVYLRHVFIAALQAQCAPGKWDKSLTQLENVLRQAMTYGFSPGEFERVKADYLSSLDSDLAGADTRKSSHLARSILNALNRDGLFLSPKQRLEILKPFVESLDLDTVNREFMASWQPDHRLVMVTGNADIKGPEPQDSVGRVYEQASKRVLSPYKAAETKRFPYLTLPEKRAGVTQTKSNVNGLGISQVTFGNHIRLNLKPTTFKKGEFRFKAVFGNGRAGMPEDMAGLSSLAQSLVRESGLGGMDLDQLNAALAGKEVSIGFKIEDTYFALEGTADSKGAELVFQLLYTYLNDPGFRPRGLALAKSRYRQSYEAMERTPEGVMGIQGKKFLAGGNARFGLGHPDQADQISLDEIKTWLTPQFKTGPLEVSFAGDFDSNTVLTAAGNYLGAMDTRALSTRPEPVTGKIRFPKGEDRSLKLETKIDKGVVRVAFLTDDFWDIMQTRRLSALSRVFSERLRKQIREVLGESYSPYVYNDPSLAFKDYGVLQAVVNISPGSADLVTDQIEKIAADLFRNGVTPEELDLVKAPIMSHLKVLRQDNGYWLNSVMADSFRHPEKLDWAGHLEKGYAGITPDDLSALARRFLDVKQRALIVIQPGK